MPAGIDRGKVTTDTKFSFVLTMHEGPRKGNPSINDDVVGNAVLVSPRVALTAAHCVAFARPNLSVRSAIKPGIVSKVQSIWWPGRGRRFNFADGPEKYPPAAIGNWPESFVALILEEPLDEVTPAELASLNENQFLRLELAVATRDHMLSASVRYASCVVEATFNGTLIAAPALSAPGYARASGSPALNWVEAPPPVPPGVGTPGTKLLGIQISAPDEIPSFGGPPPNPYREGILPMTGPSRAQVDAWISEAASLPVHPPVTEARTEAEVTFVPAPFMLKSIPDNAVMSGKIPLLTLEDSAFFHAKAWTLYGAKNVLGMLTSGGTMWTTRVPGSNDVDIEIVVFQSREIVKLRLYPGRSVDKGTLWLHGITSFRGTQVHVYLFRTVDGNDPAYPGYPGHVRIMVIDAEGAYVNHRPDYHRVDFDDPRLVESPYGPIKMRGSDLAKLIASVDNDPVQDEVANGHEGNKPR